MSRDYVIANEQADLAVGNDKTLTQPASVVTDIRALHIVVTATATVGTRQIDVVVEDAAQVELARLALTPTVTASQVVTFRLYAGAADGEVPFPLHPGHALVVQDSAAIDVLDTIAVRAFREQRGPVVAVG